jgi:hypothetical protein
MAQLPEAVALLERWNWTEFSELYAAEVVGRPVEPGNRVELSAPDANLSLLLAQGFLFHLKQSIECLEGS